MDISALGVKKDECLESWGYVLGTPEAEDMWARKLELDERVATLKDDNRKNTGNIIPDIQPYRSQIDGSMITSRAKHRNHLKDHGCIEVGNEKQTNKAPVQPKGLRDEIGKAVYQHLGG